MEQLFSEVTKWWHNLSPGLRRLLIVWTVIWLLIWGLVIFGLAFLGVILFGLIVVLISLAAYHWD